MELTVNEAAFHRGISRLRTVREQIQSVFNKLAKHACAYSHSIKITAADIPIINRKLIVTIKVVT